QIEAIHVRLVIRPTDVTSTIAAARKSVLSVVDVLVARRAIADEIERLTILLGEHHEQHPLDPGLSLQSLRAGVNAPAEVLDLLVEHGVRKQAWELAEGGAFVRKPGWQAALRERAGDAGGRLAQ